MHSKTVSETTLLSIISILSAPQDKVTIRGAMLPQQLHMRVRAFTVLSD